MKHALPNLGFSPDALEPAISRSTLELHHGKHHKGYVDKLNKLIAGTPHAEQDLGEILRSARDDVYNNAAQHFNHSMYWRCLTPGGPSEPSGDLARAIGGRFAELREEFLSRAASIFGSGWCWLVKTKAGDLKVVGTSNAGVPLDDGDRPILTCDVWEHAYYLDYQNERKKYLDEYWKLVNWDEVAGLWAGNEVLEGSSV